MKFGRSDQDVSHRFAALGALVQQLEGVAGAHVLQNVNDAGAAWVQADASNRDSGVRMAETGHDPKRGGTDIPRHRDIDGLKLRG